MVHTDSNDCKDGDEGVIECPMIELLAMADTGRPWSGSFSSEIGQIKVYSSRNIHAQIETNNQGENPEERKGEAQVTQAPQAGSNRGGGVDTTQPQA